MGKRSKARSAGSLREGNDTTELGRESGRGLEERPPPHAFTSAVCIGSGNANGSPYRVARGGSLW